MGFPSDYLLGYDSVSNAHIYDEMDVYEGQELHLHNRTSIIKNDKAPYFQNEIKGILTGGIAIADTSKIRFINDKNYINKLVNVL